jgi:hypothetical protein
MKDIEDGVISHWVARNIYKVAYDEKALEVDEEETERLRRQEKEARKQRGLKLAEFEKEWLKKKPSDENLEFYGEWPIKVYEKFSYFGPWPGVERPRVGDLAGTRT